MEKRERKVVRDGATFPWLILLHHPDRPPICSFLWPCCLFGFVAPPCRGDVLTGQLALGESESPRKHGLQAGPSRDFLCVVHSRYAHILPLMSCASLGVELVVLRVISRGFWPLGEKGISLQESNRSVGLVFCALFWVNLPTPA